MLFYFELLFLGLLREQKIHRGMISALKIININVDFLDTNLNCATQSPEEK